MIQRIPDPTVLLEFLRQLDRRQRSLLVGIDGRGGSGKSTFARRLETAGGDVTVVEIDDFYRLARERKARTARCDSEVGGDFDWRRLRDQLLLPLSRDEAANYQRYDWPAAELAEWHTVAAGGIVIVEGSYSTRRELFDFYDYTVWIAAPHEVRLERGLRRGGQNTLDRWLNEWMPEEERYLNAENPAARVHLVLDGAPLDP
jgi:uridine kinase